MALGGGSRTLRVEILGDASRLANTYGQAEADTSRFGSGFKTLGIAAVAGFAVAGAAVGKFVTDSVKGYADHQKVAAQTEAVIKSTGGAAGVTADQVGSLADALERKTTVDGDAIQSGSNLLLTFTEVQNRVGAGNDIFNQATAVMTDMSVALGQDMSSSAMQLGKALNDPIKGVTALQRVGVTFTQQQKDQIAQMVKVGDVAGAQKIILGELNKEFGGSAEAQATTWGKLMVVFRQVQDAVGAALLPVLEKLGTWLLAVLPKAISVASAVVGKVTLGFKALGAAFSGEGVTSDGWIGALEHLGVAARAIVDKIALGLSALKAAFSGEGVTSDGFVGAMERIGVAARAVIDFIQRTVLPGFSALAAAFSGEGITSDGFVGVMERIGVALRAVFDFIVKTALPFLGKLAQVVVTQILPAVASAAGAFLQALLPALKTLWSTLQTQVWPILKVVAAVIGVVLYLAITKVLPIVLRLAGPVLGLLISTAAKLVGWIANVIKFVGDVLGSFLKWITGTDNVRDALGKLAAGAGDMAKFVIGAFRGLLSVVLTVFGGIVHAAATAFGWVPGVGDKLKQVDTAFTTMKNAVLKTLGDTANQAGGWGEKTGSNYAGGLSSAQRAVANAARTLAFEANLHLQPGSPTRKGPLSEGGGMEGWGERLGLLFATGMRRSLPAVVGASAGLAVAAVGGTGPGGTGGGRAGTLEGGQPIVVNLVVDREVLARTVVHPELDELHRAGVAGRRT